MSWSSKRVSIQASRNRRKSSSESKPNSLVEAWRPTAGPPSDRRFSNPAPQSPQRLPTGPPPWSPKKNLYRNRQGPWLSTLKVLTRKNEMLPRSATRTLAQKKNLAWGWATVYWINNPSNPKTPLLNFFPITSGRLWAIGGLLWVIIFFLALWRGNFGLCVKFAKTNIETPKLYFFFKKKKERL